MFYKAFAKPFCMLLLAAIATHSYAISLTDNEIATFLIFGFDTAVYFQLYFLLINKYLCSLTKIKIVLVLRWKY